MLWVSSPSVLCMLLHTEYLKAVLIVRRRNILTLSRRDLQRMSDLHFHLLLWCAITMADDGNNTAQLHPEEIRGGDGARLKCSRNSGISLFPPANLPHDLNRTWKSAQHRECHWHQREISDSVRTEFLGVCEEISGSLIPIYSALMCEGCFPPDFICPRTNSDSWESIWKFTGISLGIKRDTCQTVLTHNYSNYSLVNSS